MSIDRKKFLKTAFTGGAGFLLGGNLIAQHRWREGGASLQSVRRKSLVMGAVIQFEVIAGNKRDGYEAINKGIDVFRELDAKLSMYKPDSEASLLGKRAGKRPVKLSPDTRNVLQASLQLYRESEGIFDVTVEPVMRRWGFRNETSHPVKPPAEQELRMLEQLVGSHRIVQQDDEAYLPREGMAIDLGGIAGGYALDRAIDAMRKMDVKAAFINFSGDIHCFGSPLEGKGWPVAVLDPETLKPREELIYLFDEALSTSGAYQNRRHDLDNRSWGHLIHPALARPIEPIGSATAIHPSAQMADGWSTAVYLGAEAPPGVKTLLLK